MTAIRKTLLAALTLAALTGSAIAQEEVFRIGLLGGENEADRLRDTQCLVDLLPAALSVKEVQLFPAADYDGVVQGLLGGTLDYAELGASAYAAVVLKDPAAARNIAPRRAFKLIVTSRRAVPDRQAAPHCCRSTALGSPARLAVQPSTQR